MKRNEESEERLQRQIEQLDLLREVAKRLVEVRDLDELARHILEGANTLIPFTDGAIGLVDEGLITFPYAIGKSANSVMEFKIPVGQGLTGWAVENKQLIRTPDTTKDKRYHNQIKTTISELDVPIIYGGECIGVINIEGTEVDQFSEDDERLLVALAEHAAIALKNAQLFNQIEARARIIERLTSTLKYTDVLDLILDEVFRLIKCTEASVGIVHTETSEIRFTIARGLSKKEVEEYVMSINRGLNGWVVRNNVSVRVGDVTKDPRYEPQITSTKSELDVPMAFGGEVIGVLNVESPNINAFNEEDEEFLKDLAHYAALALRNARIYEDVKKKLEVARERHIAAETMAAIGDLAGNLVHRMNNDVGAIRVRSSQIKKIAKNDLILLNKADMVENLIAWNLDKDDTFRGQAKRVLDKDDTFEGLAERAFAKAYIIEGLADKVLNEVRSFRERFKDVEPSPLDVNKIIQESIREVPIPEQIKVTTEFDENLKKFSSAEVHLKEVFRNLVANAVEAMPVRGQLSIITQQLGEKIIVRVSDTGIGISEKDRPHVFESGFSTKEEGKGLGYGLWWVKQYLVRNGCDIEIGETKPGTGSTFIVTLLIN